MAIDSISVYLFYFMDIVAFVVYFYRKIKIRGYIFSVFNINLIVFGFTLFVIAPFQYLDEAWNALGYYNAYPFYKYIDKSYFINLLGLLIFLLALNLKEFQAIKSMKYKVLDTFRYNINFNVLEALFIVVIITWFILYIHIVGTLDLTGKNRTVFDNAGGIRAVYLALNEIIVLGMYFFIYSIIFKKRKISLVLFFISIIIMLVSGNRSALIGPLFSCALFVFYVKRFRHINFKIIIISVLFLIVGIALSFLRAGNNNFSSSSIIKSIFFGNTFSDIRDGAYVLYGYSLKFNGILYGKNYFADFISFIPSSYSDFRNVWSYGSFSANTLFGMQDHYGLRGGWFLEIYLNFGYIGVAILAIVYGIYCGCIEKIFYEDVICKNNKFFIYKLFVLMVCNSFMEALLTSSSFHNVYTLVFFMIFSYIISVILPKKRINNYKLNLWKV